MECNSQVKNWHIVNWILFLIDNIFFQNLTIWVSSEKSDSYHRPCRSHNLNIIWNKKYGLDTVYERLTNENILLPTDFERIQAWIKSYYQGLQDESDERFLRNLHRKLSRRHSDKFTMIFLEAVLQLVEKSKDSRKRLTLLPGLQDKDSFYSRREVQGLEQLVNDHEYQDSCIMISLRAGPLLHNESVQSFISLIKDRPNVILNIFSESSDAVSQMDLHELSGLLGQNKVIFQSSKGFLAHDDVEQHKQPGLPKIETPNLSSDSNNARNIHVSLFSNLSCFIILTTIWRNYCSFWHITYRMSI